MYKPFKCEYAWTGLQIRMRSTETSSSQTPHLCVCVWRVCARFKRVKSACMGVMTVPIHAWMTPQVQSRNPHWLGINCCVLCKGCEFFCRKWNMPISQFFQSVSQCAPTQNYLYFTSRVKNIRFNAPSLIFLFRIRLSPNSLSNSPQHFI